MTQTLHIKLSANYTKSIFFRKVAMGYEYKISIRIMRRAHFHVKLGERYFKSAQTS